LRAREETGNIAGLRAPSPADLLTLARLPLGGLFVLAGAHRGAEIALLAAAGITDVLDGWLARRRRAHDEDAPHHGDWLDPLCDKLFVAAAVIGIWRAHHPSLALLLLAVTREIAQLIGVVLLQIVPSLRRGYRYRAHPLGRATTVAQFLALGAFVLGLAAAPAFAVLAAVLGVAALVVYARRVRVPPGAAA